MRKILAVSVTLFMQFFSLYSEIEIGVTLLPEKDVRSEVSGIKDVVFEELKREGIYVKQVPNIPHISIFQMNMDEKNFPLLEKKVEEIAKSYFAINLSLVNSLRNTHENIFWDIEENSEGYSELEKLLRDVISKTAYLRHKNPMRQLRDINLTPDEKELIKKYGVPFGVPENFKPHITVCYDTGDKEIIGDVIKKISLCGKKFSCGRIEIVQLGYSGNIEKVLKSFELKNQ